MHLRRRNTGKKKRTKRAACMDEACRFASSSKKWETRERSGVFSILEGIWNRTRYNSSGENDAFVFAPSCDTSDFPRKILSRYNNFNFV